VNTKQLAPITGALIAGLIGVQAADCFGWITSVCRYANTTVVPDYVTCIPYTGNNHLVATGNWVAYNAYEITEPGQTERARWADTRYCGGLATYLDCQGSPHTISYAEYSNSYYGTSHEGYPPPCEW